MINITEFSCQFVKSRDFKDDIYAQIGKSMYDSIFSNIRLWCPVVQIALCREEGPFDMPIHI